MMRIAREFRVDADSEIPPGFVDTLATYPEAIRSSTADSLTKQHPYIPPVLGAVLAQSPICTNQEVSDLLADSLLAFMCSPDEKPQIWAASQLHQQTKQFLSQDLLLLHCSKQMCLDSILTFPAEYVSQLNNEGVLCLASMRPRELMNYLVEELLDRQIQFPSVFYESVVIRSATPKLVIHAFRRFVEVPTFEVACDFVEYFKEKPPIHLACANEAVTAGRAAAGSALGIIGRAFQRSFPLRFPLDLFFHPTIAEVVKEVERTRGKVKSADIVGVRKALTSVPRGFFRVLLPLLFEFPELLEIVLAMKEYAHEIQTYLA
jgi:hypothetical protein